VNFLPVWNDDSVLPAGDGGIAVFEAGVHGRHTKWTAKRMEQLRADNFSKVLWFATPPPSFQTTTGDYDAGSLAALEANHHGKVQVCSRNTTNWHRNLEEKLLRRSGVLYRLDGVVAVAGLDQLGHTKVGTSRGKHGDCQHYCTPGIPDELARVLYTLLLATG